MKQLLILLSLTFSMFSEVFGQEYFTGRLLQPGHEEQAVYYDRTQINISAYVFQSVYRIMDHHQQLLYTATLTHDQLKAIIYVALKTEGQGAKGFAVRYDKEVSGLIFSDLSNTDTAYPLSLPYHYVISFPDDRRDFPVLHKLRTDNNIDIVLDPVSRIRLKMHQALISKIPADELQKPEPDASFRNFYNLVANDPMSEELYQARAELLNRKDAVIDTLSNLRDALEKEIVVRFKTNKVFSNEKKYDGERKRGAPNGEGLLVINSNIYSGRFNRGDFESGFAVIKNENYEYLGSYTATTGYEGLGWLRYANGSYLIGRFDYGTIAAGVTLSKDSSGEIFFGTVQHNQRSGYGELRNARGDLYYGQFEDGKLVKGYAKEVDQFGYATYSKIENGTKTPVELQVAQAFFDTVLYAEN